MRPDSSGLGPTIVGIGIIVIVVGLLVWAGAFRWFGRLPGDIHIETQRVRVCVPIVSMLLISLLISLVLSVIHKLFR